MSRFKAKKPLVIKYAGEFRVSRHKAASYLLTLSQAMVQFSAVLPSRFRLHIFFVGTANLQIKIADVMTWLIG